MKICVRPEAGSRENRARDIAAADGMMARESHATPLLCREVVRENRVNQSGSVALSTEAMRGPPWRNPIDKVALPIYSSTTNQKLVSANPAWGWSG